MAVPPVPAIAGPLPAAAVVPAPVVPAPDVPAVELPDTPELPEIPAVPVAVVPARAVVPAVAVTPATPPEEVPPVPLAPVPAPVVGPGVIAGSLPQPLAAHNVSVERRSGRMTDLFCSSLMRSTSFRGVATPWGAPASSTEVHRPNRIGSRGR